MRFIDRYAVDGLTGYPHLHAARAALLDRAARLTEAVAEYDVAIALLAESAARAHLFAERATTRDLVLPKLVDSGWQTVQIIREYPLRASRTLSLGDTTRNIGDGFADIVLEVTPGTPVAVVEVKRESRSADDAFQQAIRYAMQLDTPLAYGTNGHEVRERNLVTGKERVLSAFPPAATMWGEYCALHHLSLDQASLIAEPFDRTRTTVSGEVLTPRPYQMQAINRVLAE